jgi:hypothetical protein
MMLWLAPVYVVSTKNGRELFDDDVVACTRFCTFREMLGSLLVMMLTAKSYMTP